MTSAAPDDPAPRGALEAPMRATAWYVRFLGNLGALAFMTGMFLGAWWESWRLFGLGITVFLFTVFAEALIELVRAERAEVSRVRPGR